MDTGAEIVLLMSEMSPWRWVGGQAGQASSHCCYLFCVSAPHRAGRIGSKALLITTKHTGEGLWDYSILLIKEPIIFGICKVKRLLITKVKLKASTHLAVVVVFPMPEKISMGLGTLPEQGTPSVPWASALLIHHFLRRRESREQEVEKMPPDTSDEVFSSILTLTC